MTTQSAQARYFELLESYMDSPTEQLLMSAAELGRELVQADLQPEDIVELHERALGRLAKENPHMTLLDVSGLVSTPLMELLMAYSLAFRERSEARKRAEEALRASEELLRTVIDTSPNVISVKDHKGRYILANQAMARLYDVPLEEIIGQTDHDLATRGRIGPELAGQIRALDQQVIDRQQPHSLAEESFTRPDGEVRWFQTVRLPLAHRNNPKCVLTIGVDITERKRMEEQMRRQERLAAMGQLAAGIANDFNNLLTTIILDAQMLKGQPYLSSTVVAGLETIIGEARRAAALVGQILDLSGRAPIETFPTDLGDLLDRMTPTLRQTLPENIRLSVETGKGSPGAPFVANVDPPRVQQAMMNLAVNARLAMPAGGEFRIRLERVEVEAGQEPPIPEMSPGAWLCLTVANTGAAIPPQDISHIFEPFFTARTPGKSTGLEMAQVYGIVAQHGGHIQAEAMGEHGVVFRIYLPACADVTAAVPVEQPAPPILYSRGETILLVEDETTLRHLGEEILTSLGYYVLSAADGNEGLQTYIAAQSSGRRVDLVVTDLVMPEMGGQELVQELVKLTPGLKALAITGYVSQQDIQELKLQGFLNVVHKPFDARVLAEAVRRVLDER